MVWVDIIVVAIMLLVAMIGFYKGFFATLLGFVNSLVSFVLAIFLAKPMAKLVGLIPKVGSGLSNFFTNKFAKIGQLGEALAESMPASEVVKNATDLKGFFKWIIGKFVGNSEIAAGEIPANYFGHIVGGVVLLLIGFVVSFILIRIIVALLMRLFKKLKTLRAINIVDRIGGFLLGAVKAFAVIGFILIIFSILPIVSDKIAALVDKTVVTKQFSIWIKHITDWISSKVDLHKLVSNLIKK